MERLALSVEEVAEALGTSRDCVYRAINKGEIPSVKVGTRVLIPRVWLERLFEVPTVGAASDGRFGDAAEASV